MATNKCIVHCCEHVSEFETAINQLRGENTFSDDVFQELSTLCCSCDGKEELKPINLEIIRQMCEDIKWSLSTVTKYGSSSNMNKVLLTKEEHSTDHEETSHSTPVTHDENTDDESIPSDILDPIDEFMKTIETFQVITVTDGCIVHNCKYRSKFNHAVNIIQRSNKFNNRVYHELPKRCCSCDGKIGLNVIDLNVLVNKCDEIVLDKTHQSPDAFFRIVKLSFEAETSSQERRARISRLIGKRGCNFDALRNKYQVHIHIIDTSSNKALVNKSINVKNKDDIEEIVPNDELRVLIRSKSKLTTDATLIDELEQEINERWEEASEFRFIQREFTFDDKDQFQFVCLPFKLTLLLKESRRLMSRFIREKGEYLRKLEDQYNIRLHIIKNENFNYKYFQKIVEVQNGNASENFYLFITKKIRSSTNEIPIDEVKKQIIEQWEHNAQDCNSKPWSKTRFRSKSSIMMKSYNQRRYKRIHRK
ncbi:unnamed protein product [Adineta ricciae]|uniref:K Homology domain-containing protein n=1 Tax=Adineta ricciae TaxID=249248 RepID=A0A815KIL5_ADIRI|nr:unnamed protein product [Adineta ricciae]CAF1600634.1 unnamed protein product [Adineta ricciae]